MARMAGDEEVVTEVAQIVRSEAIRLLRQRGDSPTIRQWACWGSGNVVTALRQARCYSDAHAVNDELIAFLSERTVEEKDASQWLRGLSEAWTQSGKTHWSMGRLASAERALREAIDAAQRFQDTEHNPALLDDRLGRLCRLLTELGRYEDAVGCLEKRAGAGEGNPLLANRILRDCRSLVLKVRAGDHAIHTRCELVISQVNRLRP
jgi:tetratricopeptide (TPR) repeat protein